MKALMWLLGDLLIMLGVMVSHAVAPAWGWAWVGAVVVWLFVGAVLVAVSLVRLAGKVGGGVKLPGLKVGTSGSSTTRKDE